MLLSEFDYHLPQELIAQEAIEPRDAARLMVIHRDTGRIEHHIFRDLPEILDPNTFLVRNNTKVFRARLFGKFSPKEDSRSELFLLKKTGQCLWQCMVSPGRKFFPGKVLQLALNTELRITNNQSVPKSAKSSSSSLRNSKFEIPPLTATVVTILPDGTRTLRFNEEIEPYLETYGHVPLPPYIKEEAPLERYQTVYAKEEGSVAAPTAGLHFTPEVFRALEKKGIGSAEVTLHVGRGTFEPVKVSRVEDHVMHHEIYHLDEAAAKAINAAKAEGKKILAVGTTSVRTLETCALTPNPSPPGGEGGRRPGEGFIQAQAGHTNLFITPGYQFKCVDLLLTNFHLPKSTLLMLVSAFMGKDLMFKAYDEAIKEKYRFFSFGDAMLIL